MEIHKDKVKFQNILRSQKYLKMSPATIKLLFAQKNLEECSEDRICGHLLKWLEHSPEARYKNINQLLLSLRLHCLSPEFIQYTLLTHPQVVRNNDAVEKLHSVLKHILFNDSVPPFFESHFPRTKTDVCDGLALINLRNGANILYFGLQSNGRIKLEKYDSQPCKKDFAVKNTQACVINNKVYVVTQSENPWLTHKCVTLPILQHFGMLGKFILVSGKTNELVLIHGTTIERFLFAHNTWTPLLSLDSSARKPEEQTHLTDQLFTCGDKLKTDINMYICTSNHLQFSFDKKDNGEYYLQDLYNSYGALIDAGIVYIFGALPGKSTCGVKSDAVNILRIHSPNEGIQLLELALPAPVRCMQVIPYKEHVILAGTRNMYIIKLHDLRVSKAVNTDVGRNTASDETDTKAAENVKNPKPPLQSSAQVIPCKISAQGPKFSSREAFKMCRVSNQLITLSALQKRGYAQREKCKAFLSVNIDDVIKNPEDIQWSVIGELSQKQQRKFKIDGWNFAMTSMKFPKKLKY